MKLICFRFFNYSKRKDIFLTNQYLNKNTIRKWPLARSFVTRSSSFIHLFCLITLIPLIYLITLYKFIYGVDLSWTRGFVVPGNLARPRIYPRSSSDRSNSCLLSSFNFHSKFSWKHYLVTHADFILIYRILVIEESWYIVYF